MHRHSEPQREAFIRQEKQRIRAHIDSYVIQDFTLPPGALRGYSMGYKCDCGFVCESSAEIYDHVQEAHGD